MHILRLLSVGSNFAKFFMSFFKARVNSSSNFASFFSVMAHNFSVLFWLRHNILSTKVAHQSANFQTCHSSHQNSTNSSCRFLEPRVSFSSNFASHVSVIRHNSSVLFHLKLICFEQKGPIKVQIFRLSTACMKISQIPNVMFQAKSQVSFKFCVTFQCHNSSEIFLLKHYMLWTKRAHQSTIFQTFECFNESSPNSSCHF